LSYFGAKWVAAGLVAALSAAGACAAGALQAHEFQPAVPMAEGGNQDRIIEAIQKRFNARVVRVADTQFDGHAALELRLLSDQRVWTIIVDAQSGQVLSGG